MSIDLQICRQTAPDSQGPLKAVPDASSELEQLRQENVAMRAALQQACLADMAPEVANEIQACLDMHFLITDSTLTLLGSGLRQYHPSFKYSAAPGVETMTWIITRPTPEHVRAMLQGGGGLDALEDMDLCEGRDMRTNGEVSSSGARPGHITMRASGSRPRSMQEARVERADESYFESYGYFDIHRTMISDKVCIRLCRQRLS